MTHLSGEVQIATVTYNDAEDLPGYFAAVAALAYRPLRVTLVDCASGDGSAAIARRLGAELESATDIPVRVVAASENLGFAGGMNEALTGPFHSPGSTLPAPPFVLSLNADARPEPEYVSRLLERLELHPRGGAVTGRLVRWDGKATSTRDIAGPGVLDACGMRLTLTWRHLDRGAGEVDRGQLSAPERVFGATGAASLFRRAALDDVAVHGEIFDRRFHSFREDAELAFRFAERGWEVLYEPAARALHRRFTLPERRSALPAAINYHSLKNRYLLRFYHQTLANFFLTLIPTLGRDLAALAWVLLRERTSLAAYRWLWRNRREILAHRRAIQERRTQPPREVDAWFLRHAVALSGEVESEAPR